MNPNTNQNEQSTETTDSTTTAPAVPSPKPNIIFVGKHDVVVNVIGKDKKTEQKTQSQLLEPLKFINNSMERIKLPSAEEQKKGFYHKDASIIISLYPDLYKKFVKKGE